MAEILGLGGVCVDRIGVVSRMPNWDEAEHIATYTIQQGGIVATAMAAVARLGCQAEFIGGIGPFVDYFVSSYAFATRLAGEYEPFKAANILMQYGSHAVILTKGEDGCFINTPQEHYHVPAFQVPVVDTTGAGDTFHGAFLVGLHQGYDLRQTVQFASAVAALKCTKLGGQAGIPTFQETQAFLKNRGIDL
jgi:sugar/nucleoside kinase (ribokinase family)